jgi:hypothetical protein
MVLNTHAFGFVPQVLFKSNGSEKKDAEGKNNLSGGNTHVSNFYETIA